MTREPSGTCAPSTRAIEIWYSERHAAWMLERLDGDGNLVGPPHRCALGEDEGQCLSEWIREHGEHHEVIIYRHPG